MELTEVDGVAESTAEDMREAGIETVEQLSVTDPDTVEEAVNWFSTNQARDAVSDAQDLLGEKEVDVEDEAEEDDAEDEDNDDTVVVTYEMDNEVYYHVLSAVLDEMIRVHRRNDISGRLDTCDLVDQMLESEPTAGDDGTVTIELTVGMDEMNILHRSLSAKAGDYKGMSGITSLYGSLNQLRDSVNEDRKENWGL